MMSTVATKTPRVAVLIPSYNHSAYISQAIRSVLAQDYPNITLLITDDGSTDNSVDIIQRTIHTAPSSIPIHFHQQSNQGVSLTLNQMVQQADADYIAILNSDDSYTPQRLSTLLAHAQPKKPFFAFSHCHFLIENNLQSTDHDWLQHHLLCMNHFSLLPTAGFAILARNIAFTSSNFLFSRPLFDKTPGFLPQLLLTQDWAFLLNSLLHVEPTYSHKPLLNYRIHPENTFRKLTSRRYTELQQVFSNFTSSALQSCTNPLAPTPWHWPRLFKLYAHLTRSALPEYPISHFLPQSWSQPNFAPPPSALPAIPHQLESSALASLSQGILKQSSGTNQQDPSDSPLQCHSNWSNFALNFHQILANPFPTDPNISCH